MLTCRVSDPRQQPKAPAIYVKNSWASDDFDSGWTVASRQGLGRSSLTSRRVLTRSMAFLARGRSNGYSAARPLCPHDRDLPGSILSTPSSLASTSLTQLRCKYGHNAPRSGIPPFCGRLPYLTGRDRGNGDPPVQGACGSTRIVCPRDSPRYRIRHQFARPLRT